MRFGWGLITCLLSALAPGAAAAEAGRDASWRWLPERALYALPIADSRSPQSQVTLRKDYANGVGELLPFGKALDATIAGQILLGQLDVAGWSLQPGIGAAAFLGFRSEAQLTFNLLTFDGVFGFPVDFRRGPWSGRLQWAHLSAHTADGMRQATPDPPVPEEGYSREYWQLQAGPDMDWWRAYAGVTAVTSSVRGTGGWELQVGGSVQSPRPAGPYAAVDLQAAQSWSWRPTVAGQLGLRVLGGDQRLRLGLVGSAGLEDTGKLDGREERYLGLILGLDTAGRL